MNLYNFEIVTQSFYTGALKVQKVSFPSPDGIYRNFAVGDLLKNAHGAVVEQVIEIREV